jgi:transposase
MLWLSKIRAIGMVQAGIAQNTVARHFGVHWNTIKSLWRRCKQFGNTHGCPRSGRHRVTSHRHYNHYRQVHLRNRCQTASLTARCIPGPRPISQWTVCNRLREHNPRPKRPAVRQILVQSHHTASLAWCRQHLHVRIQDWTNILFTNGYRFHLLQVVAVIRCIVALGTIPGRLWCTTSMLFIRRYLHLQLFPPI